VTDTGARRYLLIFDCDGVLVDSEAASNGVLAKAITEAGVPMGAQEVAGPSKVCGSSTSRPR
jgi:beta-phosphoglucomutase-like phosphatase (HAD superfamily)